MWLSNKHVVLFDKILLLEENNNVKQYTNQAWKIDEALVRKYRSVFYALYAKDAALSE